MINLLLINIPEEHTATIIETVNSSSSAVDPVIFDNPEQIQQEVIDHSYWDAIVLYDTSSDFTLLEQVFDLFADVPVIFWANYMYDQLFTEVMKRGAKDCITDTDLYRLPPILQRELSNTQSPNSSQNFTKSPKLLSEIIDLSTDEIFLFDIKSFKCSFANQTASKNLQYSPNELSEIAAFDIYSEYDGNSFPALVRPILVNKRKQIVLCTNIKSKKGVAYPGKILFTKITFKNTPYLLAVHKDISDLWYKVRKLKRQRTLTENFIEKHNQKEELLANAAHDMRTSLQSIILSNKLLFDKQSGDFQKGFDKFQKAIHFSGKHLLNYINEFFDPSGNQNNTSPLISDTLDLPTFSQKLFLVFKPIAQRNEIDFRFNISELKHHQISTNETYIKRILKNLLSNAFKFTNQGSVTFEVCSLSTEELEHTNMDTDKAIAFNIHDTGIGIPKDQLKSIFERHKRTKNTKDGSGLGLHICQKLSHSIGGKIEVKSKVNEGSTFILYIPAKNAPSPARAHTINGNRDHKKDISNKNKTILIIDDSEVHNLALKEYLNYTFDNCIAVNTLSKAQKILKENAIDCIVSDYIISDNTCLGFLKEIDNDERYTNIPTIVYTGKKLTKNNQQNILNHADAIVKKNAGSYEKLTNTILSFFHQTEQLISPL